MSTAPPPAERLFRLYRLELPLTKWGDYHGTDQTWQTVLLYQVGHVWRKKFAELHQLTFGCLDEESYGHSEWRFRIERSPVKIVMFDDAVLVAPCELRWGSHELARETFVYLETRSVDGHEINCWANLSAVEWDRVTQAELLAE